MRAAIAHGEVVSRLGDVFGPVVNIASRLTSLARPGTVLVDRQAYEVLSGRVGSEEDDEPTGAAAPPPDVDDGDGAPYRFRRMRRSSVKGYARLQSWVLRRA